MPTQKALQRIMAFSAPAVNAETLRSNGTYNQILWTITRYSSYGQVEQLENNLHHENQSVATGPAHCNVRDFYVQCCPTVFEHPTINFMGSLTKWPHTSGGAYLPILRHTRPKPHRCFFFLWLTGFKHSPSQCAGVQVCSFDSFNSICNYCSVLKHAIISRIHAIVSEVSIPAVTFRNMESFQFNDFSLLRWGLNWWIDSI